MKEARSKKTGAVHIISDEDYKKLLQLGIANRYEIRNIEPIRRMTITPKLQTPVVKEKTNIKNK